MQTHGGYEDIIVFLLLWVMFVILSESLTELLLNAGPLEPIRAFLSRSSSFIAELLSCGYCFSVWVSFSIAWILPSPILLADKFGIGGTILLFVEKYMWWLINGLILHRLSNVFHSRIANKPDITIFGDEDG